MRAAFIPLALLALLPAACGTRTENVQSETAPAPAPAGPTAEQLAQAQAQARAQAEQALAADGKPAAGERLNLGDGEHRRGAEGHGTSSIAVKDGQLDGPWVSIYANGQKEIETSYTGGVRHGSFKSWYANGQQFEDGEYVHGLRHGTWSSWHENGQVLEKAEFQHGKLTRIYAAYLADGTQIVDDVIPRNP